MSIVIENRFIHFPTFLTCVNFEIYLSIALFLINFKLFFSGADCITVIALLIYFHMCFKLKYGKHVHNVNNSENLTYYTKQFDYMY